MPSAKRRRALQMPEYHSKELKILSSDCDRFQHLRLSKLFSILQEISIADVERVGLTRDKTLDKGMLWVISRMRLEMERPICYDETITISTIAGKRAHMMFPRYYEVRDSEGTLIMRGSAIWLLIYADSRTPIVPEEENIEIPGVEEQGMPPLPMGLRVIESDIPAIIRKVMYSDIDLNGHMNNTRYLDWIDDMYDMHFHEVTRIRTLQINYLKELSYGDQVTLFYEYENGMYRIDGVMDGDKVFSACAKVEKR